MTGLCAHLLCGGGHDALLESVRLFLEVFPRFMIPVQIILNLVGIKVLFKLSYIFLNRHSSL